MYQGFVPGVSAPLSIQIGCPTLPLACVLHCYCRAHLREAGIYSRNVRAYVPAYVPMYVSVTLRNVNLRYRLGMSRPARILNTTCITRQRRDDVFWRWRSGRAVR